MLWNGNFEPPLHRIFFDREHVVRWAWNTHRLTAERVRRLNVRRPDLMIVRFRSHAEVNRWLADRLVPAARF